MLHKRLTTSFIYSRRRIVLDFEHNFVISEIKDNSKLIRSNAQDRDNESPLPLNEKDNHSEPDSQRCFHAKDHGGRFTT